MGYNIYKHTCCLCHSHSARIKLCIQDNYQVLKYLREFQAVFQEYNPYSYLRMCEICLMKLRVFVKCDSIDLSEDWYQSMQDSSQHIEDTNCQCEHCKAKFGNLPLLAEVIESIEKKSSLENPSLQKLEVFEEVSKRITEEIKTDTHEEQIEAPLNYSIKDRTEEKEFQTEVQIPTTELVPEVQPSTSKDITVNRKIMNCEHCGKTFTHKGDMNKHLRKHTGEQPFSCPICSRKFAHTSNLARHLKVHSGDKPFSCERCNKSFSRKDKLVMHQKTKLCMNSAGQSSKS